MVVRKPLVIMAGTQREIPAGDTVGGLDLLLPSLPDITSEWGLACATIHPLLCGVASTFGSAGGSAWWAHQCWIPAGQAINNVHVAVNTAATGAAGAGQNGVGVYEVSGDTASLAWNSTTDAAFWTTNGWRTKAIASPIAAQTAGRWVFLAGMSSHATTPPSLALGKAGGATNILAFKVDATTRTRMGYYSSATSAWPSTFALSTASLDNTIPLIGVS